LILEIGVLLRRKFTLLQLIDPGKKGVNARISSIDLVVTTPALARDF
jgi:hypothetical protein